ncbi:MAG: MATE family efflux transporter [Firmicutes bacterium]|nr:MATE family efflux transporter [Bacillota bacterium]
MVHSKKNRGTITDGVIWQQLLLFFFPIWFGSFFQQLYNTTDAIIVGQFCGKQALSAVGGTTGVLINLLVGFFVGLSSGATVIIAQFFGAKLDGDVNRAVHTAIALSIAGGAVLMVVTFCMAPAALRATGTPDDVIDYAVTYMRIYSLGMIPSLIYNIGAGILRAIGDSKRPLWFLIFSCGVNIVLDILFVAILRWEVTGVAVATVLSQTASAVMVLFVLMRTRECYRLFPRRIRMDSGLLQSIFRIGLPAGLQSVMYNISNVIIQTNINALGTDAVAAWAAYGKIDGLFWMMINAFGISITTFVGQNFGAHHYGRVQRGVKVCLGMAAGATAALSLILCLLGGRVYYIFIQDPAVIRIGTDILYYLVPTFITYVAIEIFCSALRGMGDALIPMIMTCVGICGFRLIWLFAVVPQYPSLQTIVMSYPISWTITSIIFVIYYSRRNKAKQLLREQQAAGQTGSKQVP